MTTFGTIRKMMPGLRAPAFFVSSLALCAAGPAIAQEQQAAQPSVQQPPAAQPVPGELEMAKMIWSTILAVDHANRSGNYSVLRDMSAQGFQINNDAASLAQIFADLRNQRIDLSTVLLVPPNYLEAPRQVQPDVFEVKGMFNIRPTSIYFDLFFRWEQGRWKLFGIEIRPRQMRNEAPQ